MWVTKLVLQLFLCVSTDPFKSDSYSSHSRHYSLNLQLLLFPSASQFTAGIWMKKAPLFPQLHASAKSHLLGWHKFFTTTKVLDSVVCKIDDGVQSPDTIFIFAPFRLGQLSQSSAVLQCQKPLSFHNEKALDTYTHRRGWAVRVLWIFGVVWAHGWL